MSETIDKPVVLNAGNTVSSPDHKYPPLCQRCAGREYPDGVLCGVMAEAMQAGIPIMTCPYFKKAVPV